MLPHVTHDARYERLVFGHANLEKHRLGAVKAASATSSARAKPPTVTARGPSVHPIFIKSPSWFSDVPGCSSPTATITAKVRLPVLKILDLRVD